MAKDRLQTDDRIKDSFIKAKTRAKDTTEANDKTKD